MAIEDWLPLDTFAGVGVRMIDGWEALRGGSFPVPEPRPEPPLRQLEGFRYGKDLKRWRVRGERVFGSAYDDTWAQIFNSFVLDYNAALCARGIDRWEDDGGTST